MADPIFMPGDFVQAGTAYGNYGIVLASGPKTFDIVWIGGSTSRYRHGERDVRPANDDDLDAHIRVHLTQEAADAREERRAGARRNTQRRSPMFGVEKRVERVRQALIKAMQAKSVAIMSAHATLPPDKIPKHDLARSMVLHDLAEILTHLVVKPQPDDET